MLVKLVRNQKLSEKFVRLPEPPPFRSLLHNGRGRLIEIWIEMKVIRERGQSETLIENVDIECTAYQKEKQVAFWGTQV